MKDIYQRVLKNWCARQCASAFGRHIVRIARDRRNSLEVLAVCTIIVEEFTQKPYMLLGLKP